MRVAVPDPRSGERGYGSDRWCSLAAAACVAALSTVKIESLAENGPTPEGRRVTIASAAELVDAIQRLHLLEDGPLAELTAQPPQGDPRTLARDLIRDNRLTPFQLNQLFPCR